HPSANRRWRRGWPATQASPPSAASLTPRPPRRPHPPSAIPTHSSSAQVRTPTRGRRLHSNHPTIGHSMARDHGRILTAIWSDDDFRRLTVGAQHLYLMLVTDPGLSYAGVTDWRPNRITPRAHAWTRAQ